ncbi:TIGR00730 family Rossman fold protein [Rugosimonospora acidiphila]|uniref:Cytokinin riboside 5'-monophosphate phosphoribohydrolase n=1 Tax=Rugosimonospora acidiphila TaxID=556531 RepID=A0ABP9SRP0_9ACTN
MRVAVFTGAKTGRSELVRDAVAEFGTQLAKAGIGIVYGGGRVGLMGVVADAALAAGGSVIGVIPQSLVDAEVAHAGLTELRVVETMHQRKAAMVELADAFVALPGGTGTLDELFEAWTWQRLGIHDKPVALLNVDGFWDPLCATLDHLRSAGFIGDTDPLLIAEDAEHFLSLARAFTPAGSRLRGA